MRLFLVVATIVGVLMGWRDILMLAGSELRWMVIFTGPTILYVFLQALVSLAEDLLKIAGFDPAEGEAR